jgi:hypothetical protein
LGFIEAIQTGMIRLRRHRPISNRKLVSCQGA